MKNEKLVKMLFRQIDEDGDIETESVWASRVDSYYQVKNIPFFVMGVSFDDIVEAIGDEEELHADRIVKESGNSTIRIYLGSVDRINTVRSQLKKFGCSFELGFKKILAVNIPPDANYLLLKTYLEKGEAMGEWEYDEGCLASNHQILD